MAAAATAALLGAFAVGWRSSPQEPPVRDAVQVGLSGKDVALVAGSPESAAPDLSSRPRAIGTGSSVQSSRERPVAARAGVIQAADTRPPEAREGRAAAQPARRDRAAAAGAAPGPARSAAKKPFFERELFRIVIK